MPMRKFFKALPVGVKRQMVIPFGDPAQGLRLIIGTLLQIIENKRDIGNLYLGQPHQGFAWKLERNQRLFAAAAEAAYTAQAYCQIPLLLLFLECSVYLCGTTSDPARPHPYGDAGVAWIHTLSAFELEPVQ